jgi:hypothetical protein
MYPFGDHRIPDLCDEVTVEIRRRDKLSGGTTKSAGGDEPGRSLSCSEGFRNSRKGRRKKNGEG